MSTYRSDYSVRKVLSGRPGLSTSYTYTTPTRHYIATDYPGSRTTDESSYSRSYSSTVSSSNGAGPGGNHTYKSERTTRSSGGSGPRTYAYSTESTRTGDGPGSYYSSLSYKSPYGNTYRNFSTR